ncbi:TetR/AcrR family transcriptional regulator [Umezawaea endophytica]|uniref:TetR/AcrR family transcriptional regulator n=1 Tax=Umezawaea endophytica TaxID=1654476 RepID=A0A9X2VFZ8_9PSEU|nr:TetR/AcrR family transcriptional regulator [Umezawaea endophytica]MCS7475372.1 TetR/AcrR family transcriptional regulator [Umezawaea endophytica]
MQETAGRRERKKAATRQALADAALRLFLDRGFDAVGVREIADAADVATTTLFKYFPTKESLVFDEDAGRAEALAAAVRDRAPGTSVVDALRALVEHDVVRRHTDPDMAGFRRLLDETPALRDYRRGMWLRHEASLAAAVAADAGLPPDDPRCAALAHFVLDSPDFISAAPDPVRALDGVFALLDRGWSTLAG